MKRDYMYASTFPGLAYPADQLSAYIFCLDVFIISLISQEIIRFTTPESDLFKDWLRFHCVRDIAQVTPLVMERQLKKGKQGNGWRAIFYYT